MKNLMTVVIPLLLGICVVATSACENIPMGAYSLSSDPLPDHAQVVTQAQYATLQTSGRLYAISNQSIGEQQQSIAREESDSDQVIAKFRAAHPEVGVLIPSLPRERGIRYNPNDTYTHTITLNDGRAMSVRTYGRRWAKSTIRHAIEAYPARDNQLSTYKMFYEGMDKNTQAHFRFPSPETVQADPQLYTAENISALNQQLTPLLTPTPTPATTASSLALVKAPNCGTEEGAGNGGDQYHNQNNNPACGTQATGIYALYNWPSKPTLSCVKDQEDRGTCVAFSSASAIESLVAKTQNRFVNVSEQSIYQQGKMGILRDDFDEGLVDWIMLTSMVSGKWVIPFENAWNYNPSLARVTNATAHLYTHSCDNYTGNCSDSSHQMQVYCSDNGTARYCGFLADPTATQGFSISSTSQLWNILDTAGSVARIVATVNLGLPVVIALNITPSWDASSPAGGYVTYVSGEGNRGGHAVHAVGAIDNATLATILPNVAPGAGGGYLIIKNSWSNCWADGGYMYVPYNYFESYAYSADAITM